MALVLDAHAVLAFVGGEPRGAAVRDLLESTSSDAPCLMTVINWGEVYYILLRDRGTVEADRLADRLSALPIRLVDADLALTRQAAAFKAGGGLSYADCFAAALAKREHAELVTGDREFKTVEDKIRIRWI